MHDIHVEPAVIDSCGLLLTHEACCYTSINLV